jgi:hypothetical protein
MQCWLKRPNLGIGVSVGVGSAPAEVVVVGLAAPRLVHPGRLFGGRSGLLECVRVGVAGRRAPAWGRALLAVGVAGVAALVLHGAADVVLAVEAVGGQVPVPEQPVP